MNNNRSNKNDRQRSIDGFVPSGQRLSQRSDIGLNAFNRYHKPNPTGSAPGAVRPINSFSRSSKSVDGFVSTTQSVISSASHKTKSADISTPFSKRIVNASTAKPEERNAKSSAQERHKRRFIGRKKSHDQKHASKGKTKKKVLFRSLAAMGVIVLLIGGGLLLRGYLLSRSIFKGGGNSAVLHSQEVDPSQLKGEGDGRINILMLGKGGPEQSSGPDLTDTIIIASIDPIADEATLLSIPRDFWVKSPAGNQSKINQVYFDAKQRALNKYSYNKRSSDEAKESSEKAGIEAVEKVVTDVIGVPIHYYSMIDFAGFKKAVDTVGGVDIDVSKEMAVSETMWLAGTGRYYLNVKPGRQHFDGVKALAFSRSRKTSARGDYARADRQRAVLIGLKDKILSTGTLANPVKINQLISDFEGQLASDFSVNEMLRLYDLGKEIASDKITSAGLDKYVSGDMISGLSVQVPKAGLFDYSEIHHYVRNEIMRDSFLKKENSKILVLNGTSTAGLATKKADELKSYGYNVSSVGDAPTSNYDKTVLVDMRSGVNKYTLHYLQKRMGVQSVSSLPDSSISVGDADFVVIIGADKQ